MSENLSIIKLLSVFLIFLTALSAGIFPFYKRWRAGVASFPTGEALASGVFLGAGLIHMLGDASSDFAVLHFNYPLPFLIAGITFLLFLALEHVGREFYEHKGSRNSGFALVAFAMLSIHSLFAGAALGLNTHLTVVLVLLLAILAHKWAASFALASQLIKSQLSRKNATILFFIFTLMTPVGIYMGDLISTQLEHQPLVEPTFNAIAAGTFLYLGTLHGLSRSIMIEKCCNLKNFTFVIIGFAIMAIVALWT